MSDPEAKQPTRKRPPSIFAKGDLLEGISRGECPVCHATQKTTRKYIHSFLYEGMMSPMARQDFLEGGGFCRDHFWQAKAIEEECWEDGFGVSILCENLVDLFLKDMEALSTNKNPRKAGVLGFRTSVRKRNGTNSLIPGRRCLACETSKSSEEHNLKALAEWLEEPDFRGPYEQSQGVCIRHLQGAFERWEPLEAFEVVRTVAGSFVRLLVSQLREFQRKHDYRFKHEPRGLEWSSPERAIEFLIGPRPDWNHFKQLQPNRKGRSRERLPRSR
jgi:hypothetical protein